MNKLIRIYTDTYKGHDKRFDGKTFYEFEIIDSGVIIDSSGGHETLDDLLMELKEYLK